MSDVEDVNKLYDQLQLALLFIREVVRIECYTMCGCQDEAKRVLEKIKEIEPGNVPFAEAKTRETDEK